MDPELVNEEEVGLVLEKKKKASKKKPVADESLNAAVSSMSVSEPAEEEEVSLVLSGKKKASKAKPSASVIEAPVEEISASPAAASSESMEVEEESNGVHFEDEEEDDDDVPNDDHLVDLDDDSTVLHSLEAAWSQSDREYGYSDLLTRAFAVLRITNPHVVAGFKQKYSFKVPQVGREGTKKTVFINFGEICESMKRPQEHVLNFMLAEMGTSGSVDANNRLTVKGRFQPKSIETILRRYISEYVLCNMCSSLNTELKRDSSTRLFLVNCKSCEASRSVSAIKSGFVAQVGKRKK